jgi:hypothetical protein
MRAFKSSNELYSQYESINDRRIIERSNSFDSTDDILAEDPILIENISKSHKHQSCHNFHSVHSDNVINKHSIQILSPRNHHRKINSAFNSNLHFQHEKDEINNKSAQEIQMYNSIQGFESEKHIDIHPNPNHNPHYYNQDHEQHQIQHHPSQHHFIHHHNRHPFDHHPIDDMNTNNTNNDDEENMRNMRLGIDLNHTYPYQHDISHQSHMLPSSAFRTAYIDAIKTQFFYLGLSSGASLQMFCVSVILMFVSYSHDAGPINELR